MATKKKVVILGGGLAGLPLALHIEKSKRLSQRVDVVMIDKKEYFEMNCESVRFLVQPEIHHKFVAPYSNYLKTTQFICANIHTVDGQHVIIEREGVGDSEIIPYDYLIIALGTKYDFFKASAHTLQERKEELETFAQRIGAARKIIIIGGRTVGVEFMGEILNKYPDKNITIVHSGTTLLDNWPSAGYDLISKYTKKKNLTIILGRKVVKSENDLHYLDDGTIIEADMKVVTSGLIPNDGPLHPLFSSSLSPSHCLRVGPSLMVEGFDNVFAIGDIVDLKIPKLAANIRLQKKTIVKNLEALVFGKEPSSQLKSSKLQEVSLVSIGPSYAIMVLPIAKSMVSFAANNLISHFKTNMFIRLTKNPTLI